jgi:hypothetical protein
VRADGAEEDTIEPIFAGHATDWEIDGTTITPVEGLDQPVRLFGALPRLLGSMIDNGMDDPCADWEEGQPIDLGALVGQRFRFVQVKDEDATKRLGKQKDRKDPTKSYDRKALEVSACYGEGEATPAPKSAHATNGKANGGAKTATMTKGKPKVDENVEFTDGVLVDLLTAAKGNKIALKDLSGLVTRKLLGNPKRTTVTKWLTNPAYLARENGWTADEKYIELA